jgi:hypothetical protein
MTSDSSSTAAAIPKTFVSNFVTFLFLGASVLGWCYRYTDWIEIVGGFLSLAGILSWLAFVLNVIPKNRMEEFQAWADGSIFNNARVKWFVLGLLVIGLAGASFLGTVEVTWMAGEGNRSVWIHRVGKSEGEAVPLMPGKAVRNLFWTVWTKPTKVRVKVSGFPDRTAEITPWQRYELKVSDSFYRPVVLFRPTVDLLNMLRNEPMNLSVKVDSQSWMIPQYDGRSVWIGCDADVEVPEAKQGVWRAILTTAGQPETSHYWVHPLTLTGAIPNLRPGQTIEVALLRDDRSAYTSGKFTVLPAPSRQAFPQEETLDVPKH